MIAEPFDVNLSIYQQVTLLRPFCCSKTYMLFRVDSRDTRLAISYKRCWYFFDYESIQSFGFTSRIIAVYHTYSVCHSIEDERICLIAPLGQGSPCSL